VSANYTVEIASARNFVLVQFALCIRI